MSKVQWLVLSLLLCAFACSKVSNSGGSSGEESSQSAARTSEATPPPTGAAGTTASTEAPARIAKPEKEREKVDIGDGKTMWIEPLRHQNLTLLPVSIDPQKVDKTEYLTLDEGMKSKEVKISEVSDEGEVNELRVRNRSDKPLFLLAGEVIIGGKQDRIIGKTLVIQAGERTTVPVFCVEQGRWAGRKADFSSAESIAHLKLRSVANYGSQGSVWSEVADKNAARGQSNSTDTYRGVATKKGAVEDYKVAIEAARSRLLPGSRIEGEPVVGFAIAYNGEIVGIESFQSPSLFGKLRPKILHSYYVDAIDREYDKERSSRSMRGEARSKGGVYKGRKSGRKSLGKGYENKASKNSSWERGKLRGTEVRVKKGKKRPKGEGDEGEDEEAPEDEPLYDSVKL